MNSSPRWSRYVAIGDSFTEGLWDSPAGPENRQRGWADILAGILSERRVAAGESPLEYANLAIRGRLLRPIIGEQVPVALELKPDLVSLVGGGNDILRPRVDVDRLARNLEATLVGLRRKGIDVLLATGYDAGDAYPIRLTRPHVALYNTLIWSMARRHGAYVLDLWGIRSLADWRMWDEDRIHLTTDGHARVAQAALVGLGLEPDRPDWDDPLAPQPPMGFAETARWNAHWVRHHLVPWVGRHVQGRSSGDLLGAKRPELAPVE